MIRGNARYIRSLGRLGRAVAAEQSRLAEGVWNPRFCEAEPEMGNMLEAVYRFLDEVKPRRRRKITPS